MSMSHFSTPAILLRRIVYGDHDLILTLLTREQGKIPVIAKHAQKSTKRFAGVLEPFSLIEAVCAKGRGNLLVLHEATLIRPHDRIRTDIHKTAYVNFWAETINSWVEEGKNQTALYELLQTALQTVDSERMPPDITSIFFQMRFLALSGLLPNLLECCACRSSLESVSGNLLIPHFRKGGVICRTCGSDLDDRMCISKGTMKKLLWINSDDVNKAERIRFTPQGIRESLFFLESFVAHQIGKELKSLKFLRSMRKP